MTESLTSGEYLQINNQSSCETNARILLPSLMAFCPKIKSHENQWLEEKSSKGKRNKTKTTVSTTESLFIASFCASMRTLI